MTESNIVCEEYGISEGDINYLQNATSKAARTVSQNLKDPTRQCVADQIKENGKSEKFLESRGLKTQ